MASQDDTAEIRKFEFTRGRVDACKCPPGKSQALFWDTKQPGLGLRVTANGQCAFIFEMKLGRQTIRMTIGPASMPIRVPKDKKGNPTGPGADGEALRLASMVKQGVDPRQEKAAQVEKDQTSRAAAKAARVRESLTVGEAWVVYLAARKAKWAPRTFLDHVRLAAAGGEQRKRGEGVTVSGPLAPLMSLKLVDLNADCLAAWLEEEAATRASNAAHAFRLIRGFIRWCGDHPEYRQLISADAYRSKAVSEAVPSAKSKEGDSLQREQLQSWFAAVGQIRNPVISAYLQGLLITGARREELASLRWEDVDFKWGSLTIKDKVEGLRVIPLTPYLASVLAKLPRANEWVFSSARQVIDAKTKEMRWENASDTGHITEPRIAHTKALAAAGLPHVSLHGLRRSFGTLCEWVEMPSGIAAQIMGHKPSALAEKHYRRRPIDLLRMWHEKIEAWMLEQAEIDFTPAKAKPALQVVSA